MWFTRCPVCDGPFWVSGPSGVMVHLLESHSDSGEARWVRKQLRATRGPPRSRSLAESSPGIDWPGAGTAR
jgi:hypothetical protein